MYQIKSLLLVTFSLISLIGSAQKIIEKNIDHKDRTINMDVAFARHIEVKTWNEPNIYFKASVYTEDEKFQDLYELDINEGSSSINIVSKAEPIFEAYRTDCLKNNPSKKRYCYNTGDLIEFNYTLYVPKKATFKIKSINGSLKSEIIEGEFKAELINGDIEIDTYSGNLDLSTINGEIDLKMINADLMAETIHGDIYADEKLKFNSEDRYVGQKISGRTAQGKNRLRLNTINGNMYLRL